MYGANSCWLNSALNLVLSVVVCGSRIINPKERNHNNADYHRLDAHEVADVVLRAKENLNKARMQR
jgi:hypothetical protein